MKKDELKLFLCEIRRTLPTEIRQSEPMSRHCSFRIGGECDAMLFPRTGEEAAAILAMLSRAGEVPFLLGNGTNLLITDGPFHRIVLNLTGMDAVGGEGLTLTAGAGATLAQLAVQAARRGLTGLEFAHGIPGTVGGGVSMNAGAYGGELKDVVTSVCYLTGQGLRQETADGGFSYRHSVFSDTDKLILSARFQLREGDPEAIRQRMRELMDKRRASQPLDMPSAGSTFKRPVGGYAAALIDQAGLKGYTVGGAQVSEKHAGFLVNRGGATFDDVLRLMDHVRETVHKRSGIWLEPEVKILRG